MTEATGATGQQMECAHCRGRIKRCTGYPVDTIVARRAECLHLGYVHIEGDHLGSHYCNDLPHSPVATPVSVQLGACQGGEVR